jgi:hypothetical protein
LSVGSARRIGAQNQSLGLFHTGANRIRRKRGWIGACIAGWERSFP